MAQKYLLRDHLTYLHRNRPGLITRATILPSILCALIPSQVCSHYVSPGFSGIASDRFTIEHSGFLDNLKAGQPLLGYTARGQEASIFDHPIIFIVSRETKQ